MAEKKRRKNERKDGLIQVQTDCGRDPVTGKRIRKYFYGKTKKEAEAKRDEYLKKRDLNMDERSDYITVKEWADEWLTTYKSNISYKQKKNYESIINVALSPLHQKQLCDIRNSDLQYLANSLGHYSNSHIGKIKNTINGIFNRARVNKLLVENPADGLIYPVGSVGTHRNIEQWEIDLIRNNWHIHRTGIWFMIMLYCGLRRGEALALTWDKIDFKKSEILVNCSISFVNNQPVIGATKTSAGTRTIPIPKILLSALEKERTTSKNGEC